MKNRFNIKVLGTAAVLAGVFLLVAGYAHALSLGTQITINDGINNQAGSAAAQGTAKEDNECEPGMVQSQAWDLEGFFLNGTKLSIVSGYNLYAGQDGGNGKIMKAGDIFIDTDNDAVYSPNTSPAFGTPPAFNTPLPGYSTIANGTNFNYDYVLDIDWANGTYDVVLLDDNSLLKIGEYGSQYNKPSNPWQYVSDGSIIGFGNIENLTNPDLQGLQGWGANDTHYVATFDLSFLQSTSDVLLHNTMECGNDNLLGRTPVPEPGTLLLLGPGLIALAGLRRRSMKRK